MFVHGEANSIFCSLGERNTVQDGDKEVTQSMFTAGQSPNDV